MLTLSFRSLCVALALALLAGCDRQDADPVQPTPVEEVQTAPVVELAGLLDRSFAGQPIPQAIVRDPQGATLSLGGGDQPVLLNLWATWCAPCVVEMPLLDTLAAEFGDQIQVVTVSVDMNGAGRGGSVLRGERPAASAALDGSENNLAFAYGGGAVLPLTILYDREGREVWRVIGAYDWASDVARERVAEALAGGSGSG